MNTARITNQIRKQRALVMFKKTTFDTFAGKFLPILSVCFPGLRHLGILIGLLYCGLPIFVIAQAASGNSNVLTTGGSAKPMAIQSGQLPAGETKAHPKGSTFFSKQMQEKGTDPFVKQSGQVPTNAQKIFKKDAPALAKTAEEIDVKPSVAPGGQLPKSQLRSSEKVLIQKSKTQALNSNPMVRRGGKLVPEEQRAFDKNVH